MIIIRHHSFLLQSVPSSRQLYSPAENSLFLIHHQLTLKNNFHIRRLDPAEAAPVA
jgi:hypothetical protein